jgi:hypothetical protein
VLIFVYSQKSGGSKVASVKMQEKSVEQRSVNHGLEHIGIQGEPSGQIFLAVCFCMVLRKKEVEKNCEHLFFFSYYAILR